MKGSEGIDGGVSQVKKGGQWLVTLWDNEANYVICVLVV